ncbi:hypothetical protein CKM354_001149000 [Cercospora kikuchii]|uniref:DUF7730 domain-containing protein n=1 Tax=Cercospora kikuchii TaxID=84275 RepID=A0A9P3CYK1_9PEZI|nr:uncharacterized protein CKM354_001149000 [Cercospora kikuchii]GIZ48430.1 hypothetical protein CKM354_001149000 [Cercospora kikuchii]
MEKKNGLSTLLSRLGIKKTRRVASTRGYRKPPYKEFHEPELRSLPSPRPSTPGLGAYNQLQSSFFWRIPVEIRLIIWEYVLDVSEPNGVLHLDIRDGTLRYCNCFERDLTKLGFRHICWGSRTWHQREGEEDANFNAAEHWGARRLLGPLLTCKLIYHEAVDAIYRCNTFDFRRAASVNRLPHVILPHRLQQIRSMKISTAFSWPVLVDWKYPFDYLASSFRYRGPDHPKEWLAACRTLASMENLAYLEVTIAIWPRDHRQGSSVEDEAVLTLLKPLVEVRAKQFMVVLTTSLTPGIRKELEKAPFEISQRERAGIGFYLDAWDD